MDPHLVALVTAAGAALTAVAAGLAALGRLASLTKACGSAWRTANAPTLHWPVCSDCRGYGERGPQEPRCGTCAGRGRVRPGLIRRLASL